MRARMAALPLSLLALLRLVVVVVVVLLLLLTRVFPLPLALLLLLPLPLVLPLLLLLLLPLLPPKDALVLHPLPWLEGLHSQHPQLPAHPHKGSVAMTGSIAAKRGGWDQ